MAIVKRKILLADQISDESASLRRALQRASFEVIWAEDGSNAYQICLEKMPRIILCEIELHGVNGLQLFSQVKQNYRTRDIPFVFLTSEKELDQRVKSMALGVDDFITRPLYPDEVTARLESLLHETEIVEETRKELQHGFAGNLKEMNLVDLIQTMELGKKSGILKLQRNSHTGYVYIFDGQVYDATMENFVGKQALYRLLTWLDGSFQVEIKSIHTTRAIAENNKEIIGEGVVRIDRWRQISSLLPPLNTFLRVTQLSNGHLLTNSEKEVAQLFGTGQPIFEIVDECKLDDIECLEIIKRLYAAGVLERHLTESALQERRSFLPRPQSTAVQVLGKQHIHRTLARLIKKTGSNGKKLIVQSHTGSELIVPEKDAAAYSPSTRKKSKLFLTKSELMLIRQRLA